MQTLKFTLLIQVHIPISCAGCLFTAINHHLMAIFSAMQQPKTTPTKTGTTGLYNAEYGADGNRRIESVAAGCQGFKTRLGG